MLAGRSVNWNPQEEKTGSTEWNQLGAYGWG